MGEDLAAHAPGMSLSILDWHRRYTQQARWTNSVREYLFRKSGINQAKLILEVGSGTGALLAELAANPSQQIHGLDIDLNRLQLAHKHAPAAYLACGDAHHLPYANKMMDGCFCHYLMLWVREPATVLAEMVRVTRPGGPALVLAEPDYGGRIDYPAALETLGEWQMAALIQQGANPKMGRQLAGLCASSGLVSVEVGVLGGEWKSPPGQEELISEWAVYKSDFENLGLGSEERVTLNHLQEIDRSACENGERILFLPTFFAWGRVPK